MQSHAQKLIAARLGLALLTLLLVSAVVFHVVPTDVKLASTSAVPRPPRVQRSIDEAESRRSRNSTSARSAPSIGSMRVTLIPPGFIAVPPPSAFP